MPIADEQEATLFEQPCRTQDMNAPHGCGIELRVFLEYSATSEHSRADMSSILRFHGGLAQQLRAICGYRAGSSSHFVPSAAPGRTRAANSSALAKTKRARAANLERPNEAERARAAHPESPSVAEAGSSSQFERPCGSEAGSRLPGWLGQPSRANFEGRASSSGRASVAEVQGQFSVRLVRNHA